jgi:hypothetical protein
MSKNLYGGTFDSSQSTLAAQDPAPDRDGIAKSFAPKKSVFNRGADLFQCRVGGVNQGVLANRFQRMNSPVSRLPLRPEFALILLTPESC